MRTTAVLSILVEMTTPSITRLGISVSPQAALALDFSERIVSILAIERRTSRTRDVVSSWPVALWKRRLNCSFFNRLSSSRSWSAVEWRRSSIFFLASLSWAMSGGSHAGDDLGLDRQFGGAEAQGFA